MENNSTMTLGATNAPGMDSTPGKGPNVSCDDKQELGMPAVKLGNNGESGQVRVTVVEHSDGSISVSYQLVEADEPAPEVDTRSTEEIMDDIFDLLDKGEALEKQADIMQGADRTAEVVLRRSDLFHGKRSKAVEKHFRSMSRMPKKSGIRSVVVDGVAMELPV